MLPEKSKNEFEFLKEVDVYIEKTEKLIDLGEYETDSPCKSVVNKDIPERILSNHVCEKFNKLYTLLCTGETNTCNEKYYLFLNFWLNNSLYSKGEKDQIDIKVYFQKLKNNVKEFKQDTKLENSLSKINSDLLEDMNILYNLYTSYSKIYNRGTVLCNDRTTCLKYHNICVEEYKKGIIKCFNNDNNFCNEIFQFNKIYARFKGNLLSSKKFESSDLLDLPTYAEVANELRIKNAKKLTIMICSIFGPVFGIITLWICIKKPFGKRGNNVNGKDKRNSTTIDKKTEHMLFDPSYTREADVKRGKYKIPYNNVGNY
ncbi:PIR protein [Plasmodium vivax]|uniref:VIR protein n=1 Tax=Plasmodium vivax TaxID=5855 RepID=A0A565A4D8_PLAVI|nr:PIR protein [Plasmodium vivax]